MKEPGINKKNKHCQYKAGLIAGIKTLHLGKILLVSGKIIF